MTLSGAILVALALAGAPEDRLLLCRPMVEGDPALARAESVAQAGRQLGGRVLDYGVTCESEGEAARAARRAGVSHGVHVRAEGRTDGSAFTLVLLDQDEEVRGRRAVLVPPGGDAVAPLRQALEALHDGLPRPRGAGARAAGWALVGTGAILVVAGGVLAAQARQQADQANAATTPEAWHEAHEAWKRNRTLGATALGVGAAALAGGITLRLAF